MMQSVNVQYLNLQRLREIVGRMAADPLFATTMPALSRNYALDYRNQTPEDIFYLGSRIATRRNDSPDALFSPNWEESDRVWGFEERKLFGWLSLWLFHEHGSDPAAITVRFVNSLHEIFVTKPLQFLYYELRTILLQQKLFSSVWTPQGKGLLKSLMQSQQGEVKWKLMSYRLFCESEFAFYHTPQQCREQWANHLSPKIDKSKWSVEEDLSLFTAIDEIGCRWSLISQRMEGTRSEHMIKNRYHAVLKKWCKNKRKRQFEQKDRTQLIKKLRERVHKLKSKVNKREGTRQQEGRLVGQAVEEEKQEESGSIEQEEAGSQAIEYSEMGDFFIVRDEVEPIFNKPDKAELESTTYADSKDKQTQQEGQIVCQPDVASLFPFLNPISDQQWFNHLQEKNNLQWLFE